MPIYEHKCPQGHITAQLRRIADRDTPEPCPYKVGEEPDPEKPGEARAVLCGEQTARNGVESCQFFMRYDASQRVAPKHPGMSGCQNPNRRVAAGTVL